MQDADAECRPDPRSALVHSASGMRMTGIDDAAHLRRLRRRQAGRAEPVASLFRRRAFNIDSLTVGHTETPGVSRMTIVCDADETSARRIEANLYKLVDVLRVDDLTAPAVGRPRAGDDQGHAPRRDTRAQVMQLADVFRARVVDVSAESLIVEITGTRREDRPAARRAAAVRRARDGAHRPRRDGARRRGPPTRLADRFAGEDADEDASVSYSV